MSKFGFEKENPYGGFKHNFQNLRGLSRLEEQYTEYPRLDVSCQVLEGVLKHTSHMRKDRVRCIESVCRHRCCDYAEFVGEEDGRILVNYQKMLTARIISYINGYLVNDKNTVDFVTGMTDSYAMEGYRKLLVCDP